MSTNATYNNVFTHIVWGLMCFESCSLFCLYNQQIFHQIYLELNPVTYLSGSSKRRPKKLISSVNPEHCTHILPMNARTLWLTLRCTKTPKYWWLSSWSTRAAVYLLRSSRLSTTSSVSLSWMRNTWRRPFSVPMS